MATIVHVSDALGTGVVSVVVTLMQSQIENGHEVFLIGSRVRPDTDPDLLEKLPNGVNFLELSMKKDIGLWDVRDCLALRRMLKDIAPDAVHLHSSKAGAIGRFAALGLGAQVIYQPHGFSFLRADVSKLSRVKFGVIEGILGLLPGHIAACSNGEAISSRPFLGWRKIDVIPNGIVFKNVDRREFGASSSFVVGTCGRVCIQKDPFFFAKVAELCGSDYEFRWIGTGDYPEAISALHKAGVDVLGWRTNAQVPKELSELDLYIQTSAWEGMPVAVIEAMASEMPVVVTNVPGNRDLVLPVSPENVVDTPEEMAERIKYLRRHVDEAKLIARNLRREAFEKYSAERMCRSYEELYETLPRNAVV